MFCKNIDNRYEICVIFAVEIESLQKEIEADVSELTLAKVCKPIDVAGIKKDAARPPPCVTFFHVPHEVFRIIPHLQKLKESWIFTKLSESYCNQALKKKPMLSMENVVCEVFDPAFKTFQDCTLRLTAGTITFGEIDQIFGSFQSYEGVKAEFVIMNQYHCQKEEWMEKRLHEIQQYRQLNTYRRGALIMERVRQDFKLTGDFTTLDLLASAVSFSATLRALFISPPPPL